MPKRLKSVLDNAVKFMNFIKALPTNIRIFLTLCEEICSIQVFIGSYQITWLSRGKILIRLFEVKEEVFVLSPTLFTKQCACKILSGSTLWLIWRICSQE
jgi:hypothetical protein